MKKIISFIIIALSAPILFESCSEDFIEKTKNGEETETTFYISEENCEMAVNATYSVLITRGGFSRNYWSFGDVASDDSEAAGEPGGSDQPSCQDIDQLNITSGNNFVSDFYKDMYQGIYMCNVAIEKLPQGQFSDGKKARLIAEARFMRAFYHHHLNLVYGGVRIVDHLLIPEEYQGPRNTVAEVLHFVQDEMKAVAAILPKSYSSSSDNGRATKGAALGYLLKAQVFESSYAQRSAAGEDPANYWEACTEKWAEAMTVFQEIEALNYYELEPDFADLWPVYGENSVEHMFTGHSVSYQGDGGKEDINQQIVGGVHCVYQSCRGYYDADGVLTQKPSLYGLNAPSYELAAEFEVGDPRADLTITYDGELQAINLGGVIDTLPAGPSYNSPTKMAAAKYDPFPWEWLESITHYGPRDLKFLRYADVILLAAEAAYNNNDNPTAIELINRIRTRARNSGPGSAVPAIIDAVDYAAIKHERRVELALEAHRYFDIVRWGQANELLTGTIRASDTLNGDIGTPLEWVVGKHEYFPIPESEISLNQGKMAQNPQY